MSKKKEEFNFIFHGKFDVSEISRHLSTYEKEWKVDTSRQDLHGVHKHTESAFIYEYPSSWKISEPYSLQKKSTDMYMLDMIEPIIKQLELIHQGRVGKVLFIKLPPSKEIDMHADFGDYLESVRRHHIAIITNPDVSFIVNNEKKHLKVGDCWEVNNNLIHYVENSGNTDRIHLLIDILPNRVIGKPE
jgi:hypothetical protein